MPPNLSCSRLSVGRDKRNRGVRRVKIERRLGVVIDSTRSIPPPFFFFNPACSFVPWSGSLGQATLDPSCKSVEPAGNNMAAKKVNIRKLKFKKQAKCLEYSASFYFQPLLPQLQSHFLIVPLSVLKMSQ